MELSPLSRSGEQDIQSLEEKLAEVRLEPADTRMQDHGTPNSLFGIEIFSPEIEGRGPYFGQEIDLPNAEEIARVVDGAFFAMKLHDFQRSIASEFWGDRVCVCFSIDRQSYNGHLSGDFLTRFKEYVTLELEKQQCYMRDYNCNIRYEERIELNFSVIPFLKRSVAKETS